MMANHNLWIGALAGCVLTGLLTWFLYQQAQPVINSAAVAPQDKVALTPKIPSVSYDGSAASFAASNSQSPLTSAPAPAKALAPTQPSSPVTPKAEAVQPQVAKVKVDAETEAAQPQVTKVTAEAIGLPESLDLSAADLAKLSPAERAKYDEMLAAYREVRSKVLQLHQEREQLKQRMDKIFEQNASVEQQLESMRQHLRANEAAARN